jgi:hypothetical protein
MKSTGEWALPWRPSLCPFSTMGTWGLPVDPFAPYIWDIGTLPRCKHFLWLAHQECLPTAALLCYRNIVESPHCAYCGHTETQHHLLLNCPLAAMVWKAADWPVVPHLSSFREPWTVPSSQVLPPQEFIPPSSPLCSGTFGRLGTPGSSKLLAYPQLW